MTSPLAMVPRAIQLMTLIELLMNFTEPSQNPALTPPGCRLLAVRRQPFMSWLLVTQLHVLGVMMHVKIPPVRPRPMCQKLPIVLSVLAGLPERDMLARFANVGYNVMHEA